MKGPPDAITIRNTREEDFEEIIALCLRVYPSSVPWQLEQLASHVNVFPEGQLVAIDRDSMVVGMAASLIVFWDDYNQNDSWQDFTDRGFFRNHDCAKGKTLYGAEVMVDPARQGCGIGKKLYAARRELTQRLRLKRIRAGARLRHYHQYADKLTAAEYVQKILAGELGDPTLSFQLKQGFEVFGVVQGYIRHDPSSRGWAALIEWLNPDEATVDDVAKRDPRFTRHLSS